MHIDLPYDWTFLALRVALILVIYLFLWRVAKSSVHDLVAAAEQTSGRKRSRARLVVLDGGGANLRLGAAFTLDRRSMIGRSPACDIVIDDAFLSAEHAEIVWTGDEWLLRDMESTNGAMVNERVTRETVTLRAGDVVQLGSVKLQFVS